MNGLIAYVEQTGSTDGFDAVVETALAGHFHIDSSTARPAALEMLGTIRRNSVTALVEIASGTHCSSVSRRRMHLDFAGFRGNGDAPGIRDWPHRGGSAGRRCSTSNESPCCRLP